MVHHRQAWVLNREDKGGEKQGERRRRARESEREIGTPLGRSHAHDCLQTNRGLERCCGFQKVYSIIVGRSNMDFNYKGSKPARRIMVTGTRTQSNQSIGN